MSDTKFTPGPWIIIGDVIGQDIAVTSNKRIEDEKVNICAMDVYYSGTIGEEQHANSDLIAAAPDMYKELERQRTVHINLIDIELDAQEEIERIDDVLAKARGEI